MPLALLLLRASRWFDAELLGRLAERGWPRLTPAQSLVFAHLDDAGTAPAELARRLGSTRQSAHELVAGLVRLDLLAVVDDPARRAGRLVVFTDRGRAFAAAARELLAELETSLGEEAAALRGVLETLALDVRRESGPARGVPGVAAS